MTIHIDRSLRLPPSEYFPQPVHKTGIAIHHTVGRSARSTFEWWAKGRANGRPQLVGTAYLVDRDGTVFEVFDPSNWAYQFGLDWTPAARIAFEKRFIGIELASEGGLIEANGNLYCFDIQSPRTLKHRDEAFDHETVYRGYRWFDRYEDPQLMALARLVDDLCSRFEIPRLHPAPPFDYYGDALAGFQGIIGHAMVRADKSDPAPDQRLWNVLGNIASLRPASITLTTSQDRRQLTSQALETLFAENMKQVDALDPAAGSLVKGLLMELQRRGVYLRLVDPAPAGHEIGYEYLQGDQSQVTRIARALGFRSSTADRLVVCDA
jgi:hypothetical protein